MLVAGKSELTGDEALKDSLRVCLASGNGEICGDWFDIWGTSLGLVPTQTFEEYVMSFLGALHREYSVFDVAQH